MTSEPHHRKDDSRTDNGSASGNGGNATNPAFMYIHYLTDQEIVNDEEPPVYLFQIVNHDKLEEEIQEAIALIYQGNRVTPIKPGSAGVEWRVYSYVVFAMESADETILDVEFTHKINGGNKTFKNRKRVDKYGDLFSAVYFKNIRKYNDDTNLGNRSDIVKWEAKHSRKAGVIDTHQGSDPNTGP